MRSNIKSSTKKNIKTAWKVIRPFLIIAAFYFLFKNVRLDELKKGLLQISWRTVALYLSCVVTSMFFQGVRWWVLIRAFTDKLSFLRSMVIHFSSVFYSLILPNSTVQEVVRTVYATKATGYVVGWSSAWISKILGVVVSFSFSVLGLMLSPEVGIPPVAYTIIICMFVIMCLALLVSFTKKVSRPIRNLLMHYFPKISFAWFEKLREGIYRFRDRKKMLLLSFAVTVCSQLVLLGAVSVILQGITGKAYFIEIITYIPLIEMVSMAQPFTPGGIGVRESLVAMMFRHLDLSNEQFAVYVLVSNLSIFLKLIGALPVLYETLKKRRLKKVSPE